MAANHPDYPMWSALLRWSLAQTDGTEERDPATPMSQEDRDFLTKVMKEVTVDHAKRIGECLETVSGWTTRAKGGDAAASEEACVKALEEIEYFIEDLDFARDLCKLGGMAVVLDALDASGGGAVAEAACVLLAAAAQNDPPVQACVAKLKGLGRLVAVWRGDAGTRRTTLAAISAVVRGNGALEKAFVASTAAAELIVDALAAVRDGDAPDSDTFRVAAKAAFLLDALATDADAEARGSLAPAFAAAEAVAATCPATKDGDDETTAAARLQLAEFAATAAAKMS